jgi:hypothetical protein
MFKSAGAVVDKKGGLYCTSDVENADSRRATRSTSWSAQIRTGVSGLVSGSRHLVCFLAMWLATLGEGAVAQTPTVSGGLGESAPAPATRPIGGSGEPGARQPATAIDSAGPSTTAPPPTPRDTASPGPGGPSQPAAAETVPTQIQRELAGTSPYQSNWLGRFLGIEDCPIKFYGWIQNSYTGNTNGTPRNDLNFSVLPNRFANRWQGNQYYLILEKPTPQGDEIDFGFRFDTLFGNDWEYSKDYGLFDRAFTPNSFAGVDFPQIYVDLHLPVLTRLGLDLRGGRFYDPAGFESVMAVKRPLLSAAYAFSFTPFTFLGFQSVLHVNPRLNVLNSAVNGNDRWFDTRYHFSYQGASTGRRRRATQPGWRSCWSAPRSSRRFRLQTRLSCR